MIEQIRKQILAEQDGKFFVKVSPDDSISEFNTTWDNFAEKIVDRFPPKYREKLVGLKKDDKSNYYQPVFDVETQQEWDAELTSYISRKAEWCQRYGSE